MNTPPIHSDTCTTDQPSSMLPAVNGVDAEVDIEIIKLVPKKFEVCDEKSANWLVRKVQSARQYGETIKVWAEQERRRAEREEAVLMFLFGRQLERWAKSEIEKLNGRRKSLALPAGTLSLRSEGPKLVIDDEAAVLIWVRQNLPNAIQKTEKLMKSVLNDHFEGTGELPDVGVHIEPARERFSIR